MIDGAITVCIERVRELTHGARLALPIEVDQYPVMHQGKTLRTLCLAPGEEE